MLGEFLSLVFNPEIRADYFAYSDQDDVWYRDKLSRAVQCWSGLPMPSRRSMGRGRG